MFYWNTGDKVVDGLLQSLEGFSKWREESDPESTHQLLSGLIHIQEMLPKAVSSHFGIPDLFVGNAHFDRGEGYRRKLILGITEKLKAGLSSAAQDPRLKKNGGGDFSDRPRSRGEEILEALTRFDADRDVSSLSFLQTAVSSTNLQSRVNTIAMLMTRKRPYGNQSPELAMLGELHRLEFEAQSYFGQKA